MSKQTSNKFSPEVRSRAVRLVPGRVALMAPAPIGLGTLAILCM
jgi:hypothetical protein